MADAIGQLEREPAVGASLTGLNPDFSLHRLNNSVVFFEVAGHTSADSDYISARRFDVEERVEAGDPVDFIHWHVKGTGQLYHQSRGQIAELGLRFL